MNMQHRHPEFRKTKRLPPWQITVTCSEKNIVYCEKQMLSVTEVLSFYRDFSSLSSAWEKWNLSIYEDSITVLMLRDQYLYIWAQGFIFLIWHSEWTFERISTASLFPFVSILEGSNYIFAGCIRVPYFMHGNYYLLRIYAILLRVCMEWLVSYNCKITYDTWPVYAILFHVPFRRVSCNASMPRTL